MNSEETPLLGWLGTFNGTRRIHFLDNLRAVLTMLLIFHHAAMRIVLPIERPYDPPKSQKVALALFVSVNTSFLWAAFFLVSGYAARLGLAAKSHRQFLWARTIKTVLPTLVYLVPGRWILIKFFEYVGIENFGFPRDPSWAYAQLSGPVPYILTLAILDSAHVFIRFIGHKYPSISISRIASQIQGPLSTKFFATLLISFLLVSALTFANCRGLGLIPNFYFLFFPLDEPGLGAPITFIVAYTAGVNFPMVKKYLLIKDPLTSVGILTASGMFAYTSLFIPRGRLEHWMISNQALVFALWNPVVAYTMTLSLMSVFAATRFTTASWGIWARHAWLATYIHIVPIIISIYLIDRYQLVDNLILKTLAIGAGGVMASWILVLILVKIWAAFKKVSNRGS